MDSWHMTSTTKRDLYIAFKNENNSWTNLIRLNNKINTNDMEGIPFVTSDNKYLFFGRTISNNTKKIFWVNTKEIFVPYLNLPIPDFYQKVNSEFKIPLLKNTFKDFNGAIVAYEVNLYDKKELPDWISFDAKNMTITGKTDSLQVLHLELTATDSDKNKTSTEFKIMIEK